MQYARSITRGMPAASVMRPNMHCSPRFFQSSELIQLLTQQTCYLIGSLFKLSKEKIIPHLCKPISSPSFPFQEMIPVTSGCFPLLHAYPHLLHPHCTCSCYSPFIDHNPLGKSLAYAFGFTRSFLSDSPLCCQTLRILWN